MSDIVRPEDFGKDFGLIHEAVVTGRKVGAGKEFWAKLAHNEELFQKIILLVLPVIPGEDWLGRILAKERKCHFDFFGRESDLTSFRAVLEKHGTDAVSGWQKLGLEPHFFPIVAMGPINDYPRWKIKPESWYYQQVAAGKIWLRQSDGNIAPDRGVKLEGITVLVDTRLKPHYENGKQMFENDNLLGPIIERLRQDGNVAQYDHGPRSSRFGVSADEWENWIKPALAGFLGAEVNKVRFERAIEANVIPQIYPHMPRRKDGETNTWVWYEEFFGGDSRRLYGGDSDVGGLSDVRDYSSDDRGVYKAFRPLVVLS